MVSTSCRTSRILKQQGPEFEIEFYGLFPKLINECSGMAYLDGRLLALNDSGTGPYLYSYEVNDTNNLEVITVANVRNVDWETMVVNDDEILIGEFGNNLGKRRDLKIYHIDRVTYQVKDSVLFAYPDQEVFDERNHNFDCESLIVHNGMYHLFSKNRGDKLTNIYTSKLGEGSFEKVKTLKLPGQVTDAYLHEESGKIILLQYRVGMSGFRNWISIVNPLGKNEFEIETSYELPYGQQFEALTLLEGRTFLVGSEVSFLRNGGKLYKVTLNKL